MFLSAEKERFSLYDFSAATWKQIDEIGDQEAAPDADVQIPSIKLDLWFEVKATDLYLVMPILPSSNWAGSRVGIRVEFCARDDRGLVQRYRDLKQSAAERVASIEGGPGNYLPWPQSLTKYLEKELLSEFEFQYFVLDQSKFDDELVAEEGYEPDKLLGDPKGAAILNSLVRVDCLNAQRYLADPSRSNGGGGRSEDLSRRLSRFYQRNLQQREEDHIALKALFESEKGLNDHLMDVFRPTLQRLSTLGYPGLHNPKLEIKSALNPANIMRQDARVHYVLGDEETSVRLPDTYNGLGFKHLIYMVVEILDMHASWSEQEIRPPLHLIFIEEPEAHLHAQLQQVFIRNVLTLLGPVSQEDDIFASQVVITTHSPHILYERGFDPIRYFRRHVVNGEQTTDVLNLSSFQPGPGAKDRHFLQKYMKLTHCDLFFADAAILVEGNVERLLLPLMIEKEAVTLRSASLCILEVGGAFGHRFKSLIEFLGITTLIVTDIDSVTATDAPTQQVETATDVASQQVDADANEDDDEDEDIEFELPAEDPNGSPKRKRGKTCIPSMEGAVTSNQTLIKWLPAKFLISDLWNVQEPGKIADLPGSEPSKVRIAYQTPTEVQWADLPPVRICGRTLEECFGLENAKLCQRADRKSIGLKLKSPPSSVELLATGLHKRVTGKTFDKTKFALQILALEVEEWAVPTYIKEGLQWLETLIDLEVKKEVEANASAVAAARSEVPAVSEAAE